MGITPSYENNMIIYCHPTYVSQGDMNKTDPYDGKWGRSLTPHWQNETIATMVVLYEISETVSIDIKHVDKKYRVDGFSRSFIDAHAGLFKVVFLPDCGGEWYEFQRDNKIDEMKALINNLKKLLKRGGILVMSKIINKSMFKKIATDLKLNEGYMFRTVPIIQYTYINMD